MSFGISIFRFIQYLWYRLPYDYRRFAVVLMVLAVATTTSFVIDRPRNAQLEPIDHTTKLYALDRSLSSSKLENLANQQKDAGFGSESELDPRSLELVRATLGNMREDIEDYRLALQRALLQEQQSKHRHSELSRLNQQLSSELDQFEIQECRQRPAHRPAAKRAGRG